VERSCGSCSACCKVVRIEAEDLQKPAGVWCPNCRPGSGCAIYDRRPSVCRDYQCLWLDTRLLPEAYRPDRLKVMFSAELNPLTHRSGKICAVARSLGGFDLYERPDVLRAIAAFIRAGLDVHLSWGKTKTLVVPHVGPDGTLRALDMPSDGGRKRRRLMLGAAKAS